METPVTVQELARTLGEVLERVKCRGERFLIEENGKPVASLVPAGYPPGISLQELARRLGSMALPGEGFADDLQAIQAVQPMVGTSPWPS